MNLTPVKVRLPDLIRLGVVTSRSHMNAMLKDGRLRQPQKDGTSRHSKSFWWYDDIMADLAKERAAGR